MNRWRIALALVVAICTGMVIFGLHDLRAEIAKPDQVASEQVRERINGLVVGQPQTYRGLTMFPITGRSIAGPNYITFDQAMKSGHIEVTEKGEGEVNTAQIKNKSNHRVFIMDGEEIVGAKQNRIINSSLLIPPSVTIGAPVSCVDQNRWTPGAKEFKAGGTQLFAKARQSNVSTVSRNYEARPSAGPQSDQSKVWAEVASKRSALKVGDATGPMHEAYDRFDKDISGYVKYFKPVRGQIGAMFAINGEIVGADIFDQHDTLTEVLPKLVKSYALDAIEQLHSRQQPKITLINARGFLKLALQPGVKLRGYNSPGEGFDVRITSPKLNGAALVFSNCPVHITLFAPEKESSTPSRGGIIPINRPAQQLRIIE